jgi:transcriptional regulator with XRE-family HTH domain
MPRIKQHAKQYAMSDLGHCIADGRRRLGMTQADLAKRLGITQQQVSYMEKNPGRITTEDLYEIVKILQFDIVPLIKAFGKTTQDIRALAKEYQ